MLLIPQDVALILRLLRQAGHLAYVVGGCVRDALLGRTPKDWDICTSATPEEMQRIFSGYHVVETGLKHGTLTVVLHHVPYEVTTFRVEEGYADHRHPDQVRFVHNVREDLARRDFTVNAMAWSPEEGLVDAFGGREDLRAEIIRCVGDPYTRFGEDALRILRALRFASTYAFQIDGDTAAAIHALHPTLCHVAAERIRVELANCSAARRQRRSCASILTFFTRFCRKHKLCLALSSIALTTAMTCGNIPCMPSRQLRRRKLFVGRCSCTIRENLRHSPWMTQEQATPMDMPKSAATRRRVPWHG